MNKHHKEYIERLEAAQEQFDDGLINQEEYDHLISIARHRFQTADRRHKHAKTML